MTFLRRQRLISYFGNGAWLCVNSVYPNTLDNINISNESHLMGPKAAGGCPNQHERKLGFEASFVLSRVWATGCKRWQVSPLVTCYWKLTPATLSAAAALLHPAAKCWWQGGAFIYLFMFSFFTCNPRTNESRSLKGLSVEISPFNYSFSPCGDGWVGGWCRSYEWNIDFERLNLDLLSSSLRNVITVP